MFVSNAANELSDHQNTGHCYLEPISFQSRPNDKIEYVSQGYILTSFVLFCYVLPLFPVY